VTVFIALLLTVSAFAFISYPFFRRKSPSVGPGEDEKLRELYSKRDTTYYMLKELEFDSRSGILTEDDYQALEARYKEKAISILRDIDDVKKGTDVKEKIEQQVRELRQDKDRFCPQCGARCQEGDQFCSRCGTNLNRGEPVD